jgi:AcrR family transcriptional regulator
MCAAQWHPRVPRPLHTARSPRAERAGAAERVLAAASLLFYRHGIRRVGVDRVIEEANVAKATFYRHYGGKAELVRAYVDRAHDAMFTWLIESVEGRTRDPRERLLAIFDVLADLFSDPSYRGCALVNAIAEVGEEIPEVHELGRRHKAKLHAWLTELATRADVATPTDIAQQWLLLMDGAFVASHRERRADAATTARMIAEALLAARAA